MCLLEEIIAYKFKWTCRWVNGGRTLIWGWTIPVNVILFRIKCIEMIYRTACNGACPHMLLSDCVKLQTVTALQSSLCLLENELQFLLKTSPFLTAGSHGDPALSLILHSVLHLYVLSFPKFCLLILLWDRGSLWSLSSCWDVHCCLLNHALQRVWSRAMSLHWINGSCSYILATNKCSHVPHVQSEETVNDADIYQGWPLLLNYKMTKVIDNESEYLTILQSNHFTPIKIQW